MPRPIPQADERETLTRLTRQLAQIGFALPGSIVERRIRCGKTGCRCHAEEERRVGKSVWRV